MSGPDQLTTGLLADFVLVSVEGEEISFPTYDLMSWSEGFRDLLAAGQGERKIQLEEHAITMQQFKQLMREQMFTTKKQSTISQFDQALGLLRFLDKYQCDLGLQFFLDALDKRDWPPLLRFVAGVLKNRPDLCVRALDSSSRNTPWTAYGEQFRPRFVSDTSLPSLSPRAIPFDILCSMPFEYSSALLIASDSQHPKTVASGQSFLTELTRIRKEVADINGAAPTPVHEMPSSSSEWTCKMCTLRNRASSKVMCAACGDPRPGVSTERFAQAICSQSSGVSGTPAAASAAQSSATVASGAGPSGAGTGTSGALRQSPQKRARR